LPPLARKPLIILDSGKENEIFGRKLKALGSPWKPSEALGSSMEAFGRIFEGALQST
jgi:hypothetical protein